MAFLRFHENDSALVVAIKGGLMAVGAWYTLVAVAELVVAISPRDESRGDHCDKENAGRPEKSGLSFFETFGVVPHDMQHGEGPAGLADVTVGQVGNPEAELVPFLLARGSKNPSPANEKYADSDGDFHADSPFSATLTERRGESIA